MKAWSKYSQILNDPVRNLNVKLTFQNGDVTVEHSHHLANVRSCLTQFFGLKSLFLPCLLVKTPSIFLIIPQESLGNNTFIPSMDYDDDGMIIASDNETHVGSQEQEHQNVRMHTPPLTYDIPSLPQNVQATISGTGCAVLQVSIASYFSLNFRS